jgi:hypothetical protein
MIHEHIVQREGEKERIKVGKGRSGIVRSV